MNMIGHNQPPKTAYEIAKETITDLYEEAKLWLDGEPVQTAEQAGALNTLADRIRKAAKEAEDARKAEAKPFDDGKAEVQAKYNPLIQKDKGLCDKALGAVKNALRPYLLELDRQQREAAELARQEAERKRQEAMEAMLARDGANLAQSEEAERLVAEAKAAELAATKADKAKAHAKGEGRATGLRSVWRATMVDQREAVMWAWQNHRGAMSALVQELADGDVRRGKHTIPGFEIIEEKVL